MQEYNSLLDTIFSSAIYTDIIIFSLLIVGFIAQIWLLWWAINNKKYESKASVVIIIITICQSLVIYGSFVEPQNIQVVHQNIDISEEGEDDRQLKVIVVSDYHLGPFKQEKFVEKSVKLINTEKPDLVLIPGDFIFGEKEDIDYFKPFSKVETKHGVYAVLGNHDYNLIRTEELHFEPAEDYSKSEYIVSKLEEYGIEVLRNESFDLEIGDKKLTLAGLEDIWGNRDEKGFEKTLNEINPGKQTILLQHNPDILLDKRMKDVDLLITGHTHGGQIRLPIIGPLYPIPTQIGGKYDYGLFEDDIEADFDYENTKLFVTKGIGEIGTRARMFASPEIVVINLKY